MAERRMFAKTIIDSDAFLEMPQSSQNLYFHLGMRADDDGFINNPKKIQRIVGASDDDLKILCAKNFTIPFESGVVVIKHWRIHNCIQKDRYKPTVYIDESASIAEKENGAYTLIDKKSENVYSLETQVRLGKVSIGKDRVDTPPAGKTTYGEFANVHLTEAEYNRMEAEIGKPALDAVIESLSAYKASSGKRYKSDAATMRNWTIDKIRQSRPELFKKADKSPEKSQFDLDMEAMVAREYAERGHNAGA